MTRVMMALSGLRSGIDLVRPLIPTISSAFAPFGVDLAFYPQPNIVLTDDPAGPPNVWPQLVAGLQKQSSFKAPGHLVVTRYPPYFDRSIDGQLWDTQYRGVAAVYTEVDLYGAAGAAAHPELVCQVCVHEIGHMFDLTHGLASQSNYASSMSPATIRQHWSLQQAWQQALAEAASNGEPQVNPGNPPRYYPFNAACRHGLAQAVVNPGKRPFGGSFSGGGGGAAGDINRKLELELEPFNGRPTAAVGGGLYLTIAIRNPSSGPVELPLHIGPEHGSARLSVFDPDGNLAIYRPLRFLCSNARSMLTPGAVTRASFAATPSPDFPLFQVPGPHICRVEIMDVEQTPKACLGVIDWTIDVVADEATQAANALLYKLRVGKRVSEAAIRDAAVGSDTATGAHLELLLARRVRSKIRREEQLAHYCARTVPVALRHGAALELTMERLVDGEETERIAEGLRGAFDETDDRLFAAVNRSADGFARSRTCEV